MDIYSKDDTSDTSKPGNFNSLWGNFYYETLPWNWLNRRVSAKIKRYGYFSHPLDDRHGTSSEALRPADIVVISNKKNK